MLKIILFCLLLLPLMAKEKGVKQINYKMSKIGKDMQSLLPYVFNKKKFTDNKNKAVISSGLKNIIEDLKDTKTHFEKMPITYQLGQEVILEHMQDTEKMYNGGNQEFAALMLKAGANLCMHCHMQDANKRKLFHGLKRNAFENDYDYAEYNYMTRNYEEALKYYNQFISQTSDQKELNTALRRKLNIYSVVKKSPAQGVFSFEKDLENKNISKLNKEHIHQWIKGLNNWRKEDVLKNKLDSWSDVKALAAKFLYPLKDRSPFYVEGVDTVTYIRLRSMIDDYFFKNPSPEHVPELLYWLSLSEKALNYSIFYSMSNTYLKTCIKKFHKYPESKNCYDEYVENITFSYTGSGGTSIPEDIQMELKEFEKLIKPLK